MEKGKLSRDGEFLREVAYELWPGETEETPVSTFTQDSSVEGLPGATTGRLLDQSGQDKPFFDLVNEENLFLELEDGSQICIIITDDDGSFLKGKS